MCIIAYSPKNCPIPSVERRAEMFRRNPDGAGFMFAYDGHVHAEKGFMTLSAMEERLAEVQKTIDLTAIPVVLHYRIGTHGGNTPGNTHPFPITKDRKALKKLVFDAPFAVAHNGIIHGITPQKGYSDTQEYIVRRLTHIKPPFDREILTQIGAETGSKFAFMYGNGSVQLVGAITEDRDDGCFYSNTSYLGYRDMYTQRKPTWERIIHRHQSILPYEPYDAMLPLDDDIVIDADGMLYDGAEFCMDIYGRIYHYDDNGCPVLTHGTHLLLAGMHRKGALDDDELDDELPWE